MFFTTPGYDGWPLVMLRLAEVDQERLAELVIDAWPKRAPTAIASELAENPGAADPAEPDRRAWAAERDRQTVAGALGGIVADSEWW